MACDAAGNLYIADTGNARVRFVDAATGHISTIAGNGTQGFAGDGGPATDAQLTNPQAVAVDPAGTVLYIADYGDSHLRKVDLATGIITTVAGSGAGAVAYDPNLTALQVAPTRLIAVALDAQGNVYIPVFFTDRGQMVMRVDPTGHLSIVAGGGTSSDIGVAATDFRLPSVEALAIEPTTGALLIASNDGRVYRIPGVATPDSPSRAHVRLSTAAARVGCSISLEAAGYERRQRDQRRLGISVGHRGKQIYLEALATLHGGKAS